MFRSILIALAFLPACVPPGEKPDYCWVNCDTSAPADVDRDGYAESDGDCDDDNALVFPSADDSCDGVDNDCDGVDGDVRGTSYADLDGDGYGDGSSSVPECAGVDNADDCNDADAGINLGVVEVACDGVDSDCDGESETATEWYADADGDSYGNAASSTFDCTQPAGTTEDATDCDDGNGVIYPGAPESDCTDPTDYNCDGSVGFADVDSDSYPACADCNDNDAGINPMVQEVCDDADVDEDCDTFADQADDSVDPTTQTSYYLDADADGFGASEGRYCSGEAPSDYVSKDSDCDEADAAHNPGTLETCDGIDQNCNGLVDDGAIDAVNWFLDADGDGVGVDDGVVTLACTDAGPEGYAQLSGDCDDADSRCSSGCPCTGDDTGETGGIDTDTGDTSGGDTDTGETGVVIDTGDTGVDSGSGGDTATGDTDTGGDTAAVEDDADGDGYTETDGDCDDGDANTFPGAAWLESATDCMTDLDVDGYGDSAASGSVTAGTDCDDSEFYANPDEAENLSTIGDDDCDGWSDIGETFVTLYGEVVTFIDNGDGVDDAADNLIENGTFEDGVGSVELYNGCVDAAYSGITTGDLTVSDSAWATTVGHTAPGLDIIASDGYCDARQLCYVVPDVHMTVGARYAFKYVAENESTTTGQSTTMHLGSAFAADPFTEFGAGNLGRVDGSVFVGTTVATQAIDDLVLCAGSWVDSGTGHTGQWRFSLATL